MILQRFLTILLLGTTTLLAAQPAASSKAQQEAGISDKDALTQASLVKNIAFTNIGPSIMSGRVVDFAVTQQIQQNFMWVMLVVAFGILTITEPPSLQ